MATDKDGSSDGSDNSSALERIANTIRAQGIRISDLLAQDPDRVTNYSLDAAGIHLDYSRHLLTDEAWHHLCGLADDCQLEQAVAAMYAGDIVNPTERRSALHVALRGHCPDNRPEIPGQVTETLAQMQRISEALRSGQWIGADGQRISDIVNIGIGGSDLGPSMVNTALRHWSTSAVSCHFVSNVDPVHLEQTLRGLDPATTLFIIASKSFTTLETMENARSARDWLGAAFKDPQAMQQHFLAVSARPDRAVDFGIHADNVLPLQDWVGGRFSLWSAIGLPVAISIGMTAFRELLAGAQDMDRHFLDAPPAQNMPVVLALLAVWYSRYWHCQSQVVLPYAQSLDLFPRYLQQLEMESLGKSVDIAGRAVAFTTGQVIWGSAGTNGQHSFHQLLHQGTVLVPADFIAIANSHTGDCPRQHQHLLANCLAQGQALMSGNSRQSVERNLTADGMNSDHARLMAPHRAVPGNKPSSTLLLHSLTPRSLGALTALYEHKVYAQSILCHINAFDQWGVEIGKQLSGPLYRALSDGEQPDNLDASTRALVTHCQKLQIHD